MARPGGVYELRDRKEQEKRFNPGFHEPARVDGRPLQPGPPNRHPLARGSPAGFAVRNEALSYHSRHLHLSLQPIP